MYGNPNICDGCGSVISVTGRNGQIMEYRQAMYYSPNDILLTDDDLAALQKKVAIYVLMQDGRQVWIRHIRK